MSTLELFFGCIVLQCHPDILIFSKSSYWNLRWKVRVALQLYLAGSAERPADCEAALWGDGPSSLRRSADVDRVLSAKRAAWRLPPFASCPGCCALPGRAGHFPTEFAAALQS